MEKQVFNGSDRSHHIAMRVLSLQISSSDKGLMHRVVCEHSVSKLKDLETFLKNSEGQRELGAESSRHLRGFVVFNPSCTLWISFDHFGSETKKWWTEHWTCALLLVHLKTLSAVAFLLQNSKFGKRNRFC